MRYKKVSEFRLINLDEGPQTTKVCDHKNVIASDLATIKEDIEFIQQCLDLPISKVTEAKNEEIVRKALEECAKAMDYTLNNVQGLTLSTENLLKNAIESVKRGLEAI